MYDNRIADLFTSIEVEALKGFQYSSPLHVALLFQLYTACRVQEMLTMSYGQIINEVNFFIIASKDSHNRIAHINAYRSNYNLWKGYKIPFFTRSINKRVNPFARISYNDYVSFIKSLGIPMYLKPNYRKSPTHIIRYVTIHYLAQQGLTEEEIREFLGHKVLTTTLTYLAHSAGW